MNKQKVFLPQYFILVIALASCTRVEEVTSTSSPHRSGINTVEVFTSQAPLPDITQTPTLNPTDTAMATMITSSTPKPMDTPEQSAIPGPDSLDYRCLDIATTLPPDLSSTGTLILIPNQADERSYVLNMQTMEKVMLADDREWYRWEVSPDGNWYMFYNTIRNDAGETTQERLDVIGKDGVIVSTIPLEPDDGSIIGGWLDNEQYMIYKPVKPEVWLYSLMVVNPFTGEEREIPYDFPDVYPFFQAPIFYLPTSKYNPSLTRVAYPIFREDISGDMQSGYVLRDIVNHKELAFVASGPVTLFEPKWSPDGNSFVIVGLFGMPDHPGYDFLRVSLDGAMERLTYLEEIGFVNIGTYSWSPNGRFLAFWMKSDSSPMPGERLAILDMITKEIVNYCVPGNLRVGFSEAPLWSPDGNQIAVVNQDEDMIDHVILVDLTRGLASHIAENMTPAWWLPTMPELWIQNVP